MITIRSMALALSEHSLCLWQTGRLTVCVSWLHTMPRVAAYSLIPLVHVMISVYFHDSLKDFSHCCLILNMIARRKND